MDGGPCGLWVWGWTVKRFVVIGPERLWVDRVLDDGSGPVTPEHDVYLIDAPTARAAKWEAFRLAKRQGALWWSDLDRGYEHPLKGVRVEDVTDVPEETPEAWTGWYSSVSA